MTAAGLSRSIKAKAELLDPSRYGKVFDRVTKRFVGYSIYAY